MELGRLGDAICSQDLAMRERDGTIEAQELRIRALKKSLEVARQAGKRTRAYIEPNRRPGGVLSAEYGMTDLSIVDVNLAVA